MNSHKLLKSNSGAGTLIFLCWLVYAMSYLGKVNYSANITQIIEFYDITKAEAGMAPTFFFFSYGIGQVLNGILCKKYNIKWMVFSSLVMSGIINLVIAVSTEFTIIKWLWLLNGLVLSILWPTLIRLLSEVLPQKDLGKSSIVMGTTVATGTLIIYALSSIFVAFHRFKLAFFTAAFVGMFVAVIWLFMYDKATNLSKAKQLSEKKNSDIKLNIQEKPLQNSFEKKIFYTSICVLCFCAIGVNLIKDGLTTWVPSILKDEYSITDSLSILLTLCLPILAIFGNLFALNLNKKIPDYVTHCATVFAVMLVLIGIIIGSLAIKQAAFMLIGLILVNFSASSLNSLITSIFPIFMRGKVNSGLFAGILNGFCYLGSTISSYGLGSIADNFGWVSVFWTLAGFCVAVCIVWCVYACLKHIWKGRAES